MKKSSFLPFAIVASALTLSRISTTQAQTTWNTPGTGNPIVPGYFADPTIRKFGDLFYIYATTDGTGNGYGPAQVWVSKDFVHWRNMVMNWPTTEVVWAPDVVEAPNGGYRYYYCEPCMVHAGESDTPLGPWHNMLGETDAVLMPDRFCHPRAITLDPQVFTDDDGSQYMFVGTWGFYDDSGCGWAKLAADGKSFTDKGLISSHELKDFFEGPFLFKRNGIYYFTYSAGSCHDDTYRVQYATSTTGPLGPYTFRGCILKTNEDGTVHGPGHHSILQDGDDYYIFYHRHNNPHSIHGFNRQLCLDRLEFDAEDNILPVQPSHEGVVPKSVAKFRKGLLPNLARGAVVRASSFYDEDFRPEYAVDDNNGTLWRSRNNIGEAWLEIDLGKIQRFNQIWIEPEYTTFFYQYKIETSTDGKEWTLFADKTTNRTAGSPLIDHGKARSRYVRITITDTQKNGHFAGIWNVKIYNTTKHNDPERLLPDDPMSAEATDATIRHAVETAYPSLHRKDVEHRECHDAPIIDLVAAKGTLLGSLEATVVAGKYAYAFDGEEAQQLECPALRDVCYNAPYTITAWTLNPEVAGIEVVAQFMPTGADLATVEFCQGTDRTNGVVRHNASFENFGAPRECREGEGKWQFWTVSYDGWMERIYLNGTLVAEKNSFLMLRPTGTYSVGGTAYGESLFTGFVHSLRFYDRALTAEEISQAYAQPSDTDDKPSFDLQGVHLHTDVLSPTLLLPSLVDADGHPFRGGKTSTRVDGHVVTAVVCDYEGHEVATFCDTVEVDAAAFVDLWTDDMPVRLQSKGCDMDTDSAHNGDMRYVTLEGDCVVECRVSDIMGQAGHRTPAYNEGGIMMLLPDDHGQRIVHLGVFPNYDCGNMLTVVTRGRPQYPNRKAWGYDPYMMLQRVGDTIHARTSADGRTWTTMPGSPVQVPWMHGKKIRVGIYQTTYTDNEAWVEFDSIHLWQKR